MDRFSLLLLEPREIYFEDFGVIYYKNYFGNGRQSTAHAGRLKICSKSLVFVPSNDLKSPLLKFPLSSVSTCEEWIPKSFQSKLIQKSDCVMNIQSNICVEMMTENRLAPYTFKNESQYNEEKKKPNNYIFLVEYGNISDILASINQLRRASTLPAVEQNGMIAAIVFSRQNRMTFDSCWLESVRETILMKTVADKITPLVVNPGRILLTDVNLYFQPYNNAESDPVLKVRLASIRRIFQRRYLLRPLGLEIDFNNSRNKRTHIYLTFSKAEDRQKLYHKMISQKNLLISEESNEENVTLMWQNGRISNYSYLLYLNSTADRSFNDLTQYPVMPWVISDYTSSTLNLQDPKSYRDLGLPIGAINQKRLSSLKERMIDMPPPQFIYGSHYSTPGFVLYFLVRKIPECMLCLQNGKFDQPDRMFNSVPQTWKNVTTHQSDFKELIPEFYNPKNGGDFLVNSRNIDFGIRHDGTKVGDVELPPWASSPEDFIVKLRSALESEYVSANLHKWIDLIFGYKQRGLEAIRADNLFYHLCYEGSVDLESIRDLEERHALEIQIGEFGQVPKQIFTSPHPQRVNSVNSQSSSGISNIIVEEFSLVNIPSWTRMDKLTRVCDYQVHREAITSVAISIDNLWVFSASHDSTLKMYSLEETHLLRSINASNMTLSTCIPLPNNKTVLLGSWDNSICIYNIEFGRTSDFLPIHGDAISCMDWRSGILATGSWDSNVKIWHCSEVNGYRVRLSTDLLASLEHTSCVTSLHICPDNSQLVSGTRSGQVWLWCLRVSGVIQHLPSHSRQVNAVQFSPDSQRVISCASDFFMKVTDLKTGSILFSKDLGEELNCLSWDGRTVIVGGGSGKLSIWDLHEVVFKNKFIAHHGPIKTLCVSINGQYVITGGEDQRVIVWTSKIPLLSQ